LQTTFPVLEWIENQKQSLDVQLSSLILTALILQSLTHTAQLLTAAPVEAVAFLLCMTAIAFCMWVEGGSQGFVGGCSVLYEKVGQT